MREPLGVHWVEMSDIYRRVILIEAETVKYKG
jgi:hypothetical protein